jgi:hypothetical protein
MRRKRSRPTLAELLWPASIVVLIVDALVYGHGISPLTIIAACLFGAACMSTNGDH